MVAQTLGHYRVIEKIGEGGMGAVFRAHDERLSREVAIKVLLPGALSDGDVHRRLRKEAIALARLNHPNIATIYDFDTQMGLDFMVMEFIAGPTLEKKIAEGPLSENETLHISRQIISGLRAAHELGIVHRDLKPSNIVVGAKEHIKILDFGLSKVSSGTNLASTASFEDLEHVAGTLPYIAPEILQGKVCDARTDIWSYGVLLYEICSGQRPFKGKTIFELTSAIVGSDPAKLPSHLSPAFQSLISRCLLKDPQRRYQNAGEVEAALESLNTSSQSRTRSTLPLQLVVLAVLLLATLTFFLVRKHLSGRQSLPAEKQLAILPLAAVSENPDTTALGEGLNETLTTKLTSLTRTNNLQIIPASEIRSRGVKTLRDANEEFGVNLGLELAVRRSGDVVRVNYSLVDAKTHRQLRGDTITAPASNPFELEDKVSDSIVSALELELTPRTHNEHGTSQAAAFSDYLRGRGNLQDYERPEKIDKAIIDFNDAIDADPRYALAYAGLGEAYWKKYEFTHDHSYVDRATKSCNSAVDLEATIAEGYVCLGTVFRGTGQYALASAAFAQGTNIDPTNDDAVVGAASVFQALGKSDKAEETYRRAITMRPQYARNYNLLGVFFVGQGQYKKAAEMFSKVITISPDSFRGYSNLGGVQIYQGSYQGAVSTLEKSISIRKTGGALSNLGTAYFHLREFDKAAETFREAVELDQNNYALWGNLADAYYYGSNRPEATTNYRKAEELAIREMEVNPQDASVLADLGNYRSMVGDKAGALNYINRAIRLSPRDPNVLFIKAQICNQFGDENEALRWLRQAIVVGLPVILLRDNPALDNLKRNSEFQGLVAERGL